MSRQFSQSILDEAWQFLIIRSVRWQHLCPEKRWKPIVCLELDDKPCHELCLGVDGQNPNLQNPAILADADHTSRLQVNMYQQNQTKSKTKKRRKLVASTSIYLGEAFEKQSKDRHVELRLPGIGSTTRRKIIGQRPNPCATLIVRIKPPQSYMAGSAVSSVTMVDDDEDRDDVVGYSRSSSPECMPSEAEDELSPLTPTTTTNILRRRRRRVVKGFAIDSDEPSDCYISEDCSPSPIDRRPAPPWRSMSLDDTETETITFVPPSAPHRPVVTVQASLLPLARVGTAVSGASVSSLGAAASVFDAVTYHRQLREAETDARLEELAGYMVREWQFLGATLLAVAALDTTVYGFQAGQTMFSVDGLAVRSLTVSAIASALGIAVDAYLLFMFLGADAQKFKARASGLYGTYAFFALTSRLPLLATVTSLLSLSLFLIAVAFDMWPGAVLWMCVGAGVLVALQYLVKGAELVMRAGVFVFRAVAGVFVCRPVGGVGEGETVVVVSGPGGRMEEARVESVQMQDRVHVVARPAGMVAAPSSSSAAPLSSSAAPSSSS